MNKQLKAMILAVVLVIGLVCMVGCGKSSGPDVTGTYVGQYGKYVGDSDEYRVTDEDFSLELKKGGKGVHHRDGLDLDVTWKLDGENFTMTETFLGAKIEYVGTMKDGVLDIFNGDPEDMFTYEYVYERSVK